MSDMSFQQQLMARVQDRDIGAVAREQHEGRPNAELAPWLFPVRANLIANKDGGVLACQEFEGVDTDGASKEMLKGLAASVNKLMVYQQEEPLMYWWTVHRRRTSHYPDSTFPDPISQRIDNARRAAFFADKNFINRHFLSTVLQAHAGVARLKERVAYALKRGDSVSSAVVNAAKTVFDDQCVFPYTPPELLEACERVEQIVADMVSSLPDLHFRRLSDADLGAFLHGTISPQSADQEKLDLPGLADENSEEPDPLDCPPLLDEAIPEGTMMPGRDFLHFSSFKKKFAVAVTIAEFPERLELGALDRLYSIPGELTITYALRSVPRSEAETHAERMRNFHSNRRYSWKATAKAVVDRGNSEGAPVNPGHQRLAQEATKALGDFTQGKKGGLWFYFSVICYGDTLEEADETAERVQAVLRTAHLKPECEESHLVSAFATSIPGMWKECARWKFFNTKAFAMIAPVHTVTRGDPHCAYLTEQTKIPCPAVAVLPTDYATPLYYNLFMGDLGHGFLAGPTRAGKSVLANLIAAQFRRYPNAQIIVFDRDYSSRIPILLQDGAYLDFAGDSSSLRFNPIARLAPENFEWTMNWIELLAQQRDYSLDSDDSKDLEAALRGVMKLDDPQLKTLGAVFAAIGRPRLRSALEPWVGGRVQAKYFDNPIDGFGLAKGIVGVEIGKLLTNEQVAIPTMEYCFDCIDTMLRAQREQGIVRPTFVYLAEVWHLLKRPLYREKLNDWLKTLAKRCAVVWMDTQSVEDLAKAEIFASLRDNIPNRIYLPNRNALSESLSHIYRREFELTQSQVERIATGTQKRDYLIQQGVVSRMVQLRFDPDTLACLRSDMAAQIIFDKHYASGATDWKERYIKEMQSL